MITGNELNNYLIKTCSDKQYALLKKAYRNPISVDRVVKTAKEDPVAGKHLIAFGKGNLNAAQQYLKAIIEKELLAQECKTILGQEICVFKVPDNKKELVKAAIIERQKLLPHEPNDAD
ncbi:MAG: hypothetical protein ACE5DI_00365 [Candidatus Micrarchaeia archaeon]